MSKSTDEIIRILSADEPVYSSISEKLNEKDYPVLDKIIREGSKDVALVAICVLGQMKSKSSLETLSFAAESGDPDIREASAMALKHKKGSAKVVKLLKKLFDDSDIGVRKAALETAAYANMSGLKKAIQKLSQKENNYRMIKLAEQVLSKIDKPLIQ